MEMDLFFSSPRWKILEILARKPSSPLEISQKLKTSVAFVSQQLKLLEAANLVTKEKTGKAEKGKPRNLYSISKEIVFLTGLIKNNPIKKSFFLSDYHKSVLGIWSIENSELHYIVEKLYWKIEDDLNEIEGIFFKNGDSKPTVLIISQSKKFKPKVDLFLKEIKNRIECKIIAPSDFLKISSENLRAIYNPRLLLALKEPKGEVKQNEA